MSLFSNRYFPHALFAMALTSLSINLISHRKTAEDERSRIQAQISVLESIKEQQQLPSDDSKKKPLSSEELERLKRLVRPVVDSNGNDDEGRREAEESQKESGVGWILNVFRTRQKPSSDEKMSKWDQQDLERCAYELNTL